MNNQICLTESNLGENLKLIFNKDFIHDKSFITRKRPDYRNDELKLIVEFDGPKHYTEAKRIVDDKIRDEFYLQNGYRTIRIPMFIQLTTQTIKELFNIDFNYTQTYKHGFIANLKTLVLPADFCELGISKFKNDLERFKSAKNEIIDSLKVKIEKLGNIDLVLPPSLHYLVNI